MSESSWLSSRSTDLELNPALLADALREYRRANSLSQAELARILNLDQSYVSKIETGQRYINDLATLLAIARRLDIAPSDLGISRNALRPPPAAHPSAVVGDVDPVRESQETWCRVRRALNRRRGELAKLALSLYRPELGVGRAPFIAPSEWIPPAPVRLEEVQLRWSSIAGATVVGGTEAEAHPVLPLRTPGRRFDRYTSAIRYLDRPALFENRPSYRLLDVDLTHGSPRMTFCPGTYFDKLDVSEAIAHELAAAELDGRADVGASWAGLPLRSLVGDPFDLERRAVMPAIETLTLRRHRRSGRATFLLHWRDPAKVATAAGIYGLIPAGEFQPSSIAVRDQQNDFDLWRNMVREFSEELLGEPERDGTQGVPLDYAGWPLYRALRQARTENSVAAYFLGIGLDALTLTATILTVVVLDDHVFDSLFGSSVRINAEGVLVMAAESTTVSDGLPFTEDCVRRLLTEEPMASPGACILARAWQFRDTILS